MGTVAQTAQTPQDRPKPRRRDLRCGEDLCAHCTAKCCKYFALPLEAPADWEDFGHMRWFLLHEGASVFTEDDTWYLMVHTRCKMLRDDNLCAIYETRPHVCREYSTKDCEYEDDWCYERYFELPEQVEEYAEAVIGPRGKKLRRSPRPEPLKVL